MCAVQDHDGSHIKGLLINLVHQIWPGLLLIPGFLTEFVTPVVKVRDSTSSALCACAPYLLSLTLSVSP